MYIFSAGRVRFRMRTFTAGNSPPFRSLHTNRPYSHTNRPHSGGGGGTFARGSPD